MDLRALLSPLRRLEIARDCRRAPQVRVCRFLRTYLSQSRPHSLIPAIYLFIQTRERLA